jgi:hypothetical protein
MISNEYISIYVGIHVLCTLQVYYVQNRSFYMGAHQRYQGTNQRPCKLMAAREGCGDFGVNPDCQVADYYCKTCSDGRTFIHQKN